MLLKYFYDEKLAHASYMVGCQKTGEAVIVDPGRDIGPYLTAASQQGMSITAVAETHIHADYVSGARELAEQVGAKLYVSDEGPADWKYEYVVQYRSQLLKNGDQFRIGNLLFEVLHTPGHTPESLSFLLTDQGGGADKPMGIFTGDFIFVGSIGRPDLLEEAAGMKGSAEIGAHELFHSAQQFKTLPDYLQVWPAHGAGSACGKGLGAIPSSTVGYEKRFNPALQIEDEKEFVQYILSDQPEAPKYFAVMKRVNKLGPAILPHPAQPITLEAQSLPGVVKLATVIDLSSPEQFGQGHVKGTINIPASMLATWAGWVVDYSKPVYLIATQDQVSEAMRVLRKIGLDQVQGIFSRAEVSKAGLAQEHYDSLRPENLLGRIASRNVRLIDVRSQEEWKSGHIAEAEHVFLGRLPEQLGKFRPDQTVVTQCQSGARSSIAASLLQAAGFKVLNMAGGMKAWKGAGLPVVTELSSGPACPAESC